MNKIDLTDLPPTAQSIAEIIGVETTLELAAFTSCRAVYIPAQELGPTHWLINLIGREKTVALQRVYGGMHCPLATCRYLVDQRRNEAIREAVKRGDSPARIATRHGMSVSQVRRVIDGLQGSRPSKAAQPPSTAPAKKGKKARK